MVDPIKEKGSSGWPRLSPNNKREEEISPKLNRTSIREQHKDQRLNAGLVQRTRNTTSGRGIMKGFILNCWKNEVEGGCAIDTDERGSDKKKSESQVGATRGGDARERKQPELMENFGVSKKVDLLAGLIGWFRTTVKKTCHTHSKHPQPWSANCLENRELSLDQNLTVGEEPGTVPWKKGGQTGMNAGSCHT